MTDRGSDGPIAWQARVPWLTGNDWVEIAREEWDGSAWRWNVRDAPGAGIFAMLTPELIDRFR